ncbi:sugar ABC transporter permease [Anaerocolumna cellulosilytica]|uniref:Sugar ABC transporter permease n=1 Tax=Anaerocolumna cellulosilytica TaxID=433286 RepID=A0A6S6R0A7_9FIRM|nr:ABC transporter permease subunit [Anaerocolumna cellulosilytica]MBB5195863.1 putative aldouronate transport system permease protein [Anaerocolumna cellulosilytica]BCJ96873.1 sugar ABC transporter permease [Anaerocolumna cellulosilytica]
MEKVRFHLKSFFRECKRKKVLFLMISPVLLYFIIFAYIPMPGAYIAFVDYNIGKGIFGSNFVGLKNFEFLARTGDLWRITKNTLLYNMAFLAFTNLFQVAFAIMISEISSKWFKKISQSVILLPYFISMVIVGFFAYNFFNYDHGFVNTILTSLGFEKHDFYSDQGIWKYIIVFFKIWASTGYGMIIYLAAITGISTDIYEAAALDGASPIQKISRIIIPLLKPTIILLFLFGLGGILKGSFDLFFNLIGNNSVLFKQTDIIDTFVFRSLVGSFNFSQGAAVGFYQSIFGLILVLTVNAIVKKIEPDSALF